MISTLSSLITSSIKIAHRSEIRSKESTPVIFCVFSKPGIIGTYIKNSFDKAFKGSDMNKLLSE